MDIEKELELLSQYMNIYVQLLPYCFECGGLRISKHQQPSFEYFKETILDPTYSLIKPTFKESLTFDKDFRIVRIYTHGLGSEEGIAYRYYSTWRGCKYYVGGNMDGKYRINPSLIEKEFRAYETN